jgi:hypothetical protein
LDGSGDTPLDAPTGARITARRERADGHRQPPLLVAVAAGRVMRVTTEQFLIGGIYLAVALFAIAAVLGWFG